MRALPAHGLFKARGALSRIARLSAEERRRGVIAISAGNHAQAVAFAAAEEGVDALVVMWKGASEQKLNATRGYGADVDLEASSPAEAFERLAVLRQETGRTLVHPFDDPLVIAGAGTVGLEIEEDAPGADVVVVPVGGGGLVAGITAALRDRVRIVGVEPGGRRRSTRDSRRASDSGRAALDRRRPERAVHGRAALEICRDIELVTVTEEEIAEAFRFLYERAKLACEPAGAAAAAAWRAGKIGARAPVVVVSGGNVAGQTASAILAGR